MPQSPSSHEVFVITRHPDRSGVAPVVAELASRGAAIEVIDLAVPIRSIHANANETSVEQVDGHRWVVDEHSSVLAWHEGVPEFELESLPDASHAKYARDAQSAAWSAFLNTGSGWINSPRARRDVGADKILQQRLAHRAGLDVIPTELTDSLEGFVACVEAMTSDIAVKSVVPWQTWTTGSAEPKATYTRRLTKDEALVLAELVPIAPLYVQPYIEKDFEVRAYVIADKLMASSIDSQASERTRVDWRHYDLANVRHERYLMPPDVARRLVALVRASGLIYAAIDLIVEPSGTHRFVELNPSGHFGWIEGLAGLPIAAAIADELVERTGSARSDQAFESEREPYSRGTCP